MTEPPGIGLHRAQGSRRPGGIRRLPATAAGVLALSSLALALRDPSSSAGTLLVAVLGLALLLMVEGTHRCRRLDGAATTPSCWHRCMAWWMGRGAISLAIVAVIAILAPLVATALPKLWAPFVAGIGIPTAFAAARRSPGRTRRIRAEAQSAGARRMFFGPASVPTLTSLGGFRSARLQTLRMFPA